MIGARVSAHPRRPLFLPVEAGSRVACPRRGRISVAVCRSCPLIQGTIEGPDPKVVCGFTAAGIHVTAGRATALETHPGLMVELL